MATGSSSATARRKRSRTSNSLIADVYTRPADVGRGRRPGSGRPRRCPRQRKGEQQHPGDEHVGPRQDRKSTRLNSSHANISYAVFCLKKKKNGKAQG